MLVLDGDRGNCARIKSLLQHEDYWVFATGDSQVALRLVRAGAIDLLLTDLGMAVLDVVPRWARRRSDAPFESPPAAAEGYAVLRALEADAASARHVIAVLREVPGPDVGCPPCRFGIVGCVPKAASVALIESLEAAFRERAPSVDAALWSVEQTPGQIFQALPKGLRRALLADPDATHRRSVREALTAHDFSVDEASGGAEALRLAVARRPWLILSEIVLPQLDGFELCRQIRSHSLLSHTPMAFLSHRDGYEARFYGIELGADDFLSKPIAVRELLIRVALILSRYSDLATRNRPKPGLEGDIEFIGAAVALQLCFLGRLSGMLTARRGTRVMRIGFRKGEVVFAESDRCPGPEAFYEFLTWSQGHFEFLLRDPGDGPPLGESFDQLLLEGCRRIDESRTSSRS